MDVDRICLTIYKQYRSRVQWHYEWYVYRTSRGFTGRTRRNVEFSDTILVNDQPWSVGWLIQVHTKGGLLPRGLYY